MRPPHCMDKVAVTNIFFVVTEKKGDKWYLLYQYTNNLVNVVRIIWSKILM